MDTELVSGTSTDQRPKPSGRPPQKPRKPTKRLTDADKAFILRYAADGLNQVQIAQRIGCTQPIVSRWLAQCADTTIEAKSYFRGQALRMAEKVVTKGKPDTLVKVLQGVSVLEPEQRSSLVVQIGVKAERVQIQTSDAHERQSCSADNATLCSAEPQVVDVSST